MNRKRGATAVADGETGTILASVEIAAPMERVWRALTSDEIVTWCGAAGDARTTGASFELQSGGAWRTDAISADGNAFHVRGEIVELDPPQWIEMTWVPSWPEPPSRVVYLLDPLAEGGTRVLVRHTGIADPARCRQHAPGWAQTLDWLAAYVAPPVPDTREAYLVRLVPPRPTFAQDMTPAERAVMMEHVAYWHARLADGVAVAFGPVMDPAGGWGVGLVRVRDDAHLRELQDGDPAIRGGIGMRYEALPMPRLMC